jgi:hypothetical protein
MKMKFKLIAVVVSVFFFGTTYGQDDFVALTSSQLLRGLKDKDYLGKVLTDDGFTLIKNSKIYTLKTGYYEYWQYKSMIFVDVIYNPSLENYIIVRVHKNYADISYRLIQTFPHKRNQEYENHIENINFTHINKATAYTLRYTKDGENTGVDIWFDEPFYYFQYTTWK